VTRQTKQPAHDAQKLRSQAERGRQAEELVNHPLLLEAFDNIEKVIDTGWKNSSSEDRQARDNAYLLHRVLSNLRSNLKAIIVSGGNAKKLLQLEEIKGGQDGD
jgi:hypothetical protein